MKNLSLFINSIDKNSLDIKQSLCRLLIFAENPNHKVSFA